MLTFTNSNFDPEQNSFTINIPENVSSGSPIEKKTEGAIMKRDTLNSFQFTALSDPCFTGLLFT